MLLLSVPAGILGISALLWLASSLEQRRVRALVRMTVRSKATPEQAEHILAADLAPFLRASGLDRRPAT